MIKLNMKIILLVCITVLGNYVVLHAAAEDLIKACAQLGQIVLIDCRIPKYNHLYKNDNHLYKNGLLPDKDPNLESDTEATAVPTEREFRALYSDMLVEDTTTDSSILHQKNFSKIGNTDNAQSDNDEFAD